VRFNALNFHELTIKAKRYYWPTDSGMKLPCLDSVALTEWTTVSETKGDGRKEDEVPHKGMIGFQMTVAPKHSVASGPEGKAAFVDFVEKAGLNAGFVGGGGYEDGAVEERDEGEDEDGVRGQEDEETEGDILPGSQRGSNQWDGKEPWFMFVVPNMNAFEKATIPRKVPNDEAFRAALTKARFFVMELPISPRRPDKGPDHSRPSGQVTSATDDGKEKKTEEN
jgi:hypothetical protein